MASATAKAMEILLAICSCHKLNLSRVHFEGDTKSVIDSVNSEEMDCGWMGHIIVDIKLKLQTFSNCNQVAHLLAKYVVDRN